MIDQSIREIGLAVIRGDAALWFGPDFILPSDESELNRLLRPSWCGVWSEPSTPDFAVALSSLWKQDDRRRMVVEVPGEIEDSLGMLYELSEICPYFYLNGRAGEPALNPIRRRMARDRKIEQLTRLRLATLIITGYEEPKEAIDALEWAGTLAPNIHCLALVCEIAEQVEGLLSSLPSSIREKVVLHPFSLVQVFAELEARREELPTERSILAGKTLLPLRGLLSSARPLDQDYIIVTQEDIRDAEQGENISRLADDLLSGRCPPWRALAHDLAWNRDLEHVPRVLEALTTLHDGDSQVAEVRIPSESGSGVTTLLYQLSFAAASRGFPTLIHRGHEASFNYNQLRAFLTDLNRLYLTETAGGRQAPPTLVIYDRASDEFDAAGELADFPYRLARDLRRTVVVRVIPLSESKEYSYAEEHRTAKGGDRVRRLLLPRLKAALSDTEQVALTDWCRRLFGQLHLPPPENQIDMIYRWYEAESDVPLLVFLYYILLNSDLSQASSLGKHLVNRVLGESERSPNAFQPETISAADHLINAWRQGRQQQTECSPSEKLRLLICLAALACLRMRATSDVLASQAGLEDNRIFNALKFLIKRDLAQSSLPLHPRSLAEHGVFSSVSGFSSSEVTGLRHDAYGPLILRALQDDEEYEGLIGEVVVVREILAVASELKLEKAPDELPLQLLKPLFKRLRPVERHVDFAAEVTTRYMRLQKRRKSYSDWQWRNRELVMDSFNWLTERVVQQSDIILHSRGITRYKTIPAAIPVEQARELYRQAASDFERALEIARGSDKGESPANIITSHALLLQGWAQRERDSGNQNESEQLDVRAEEKLRLAQAERADNPYATYGLAKHLYNRVSRLLEQKDQGATAVPAPAVARDLAEAIGLVMETESEAYFADEWNDLRRELLQLLKGPAADAIIGELQRDLNDFGYAMEALQTLDGEIPQYVIVDDEKAIQKRTRAEEILQKATLNGVKESCSLGDLLRYALYSTKAERQENPEYQERYRMICALKDTVYLEKALWLYEYAMLSYQTHHFQEGDRAFQLMRRGQRYFQVPRDRRYHLTEGPNTVEPRRFLMRVLSVDQSSNKGWAKIQSPEDIPASILFDPQRFTSRGRRIAPGAMTSCHVELRPAGPWAEPAEERRDVR